MSQIGDVSWTLVFDGLLCDPPRSVAPDSGIRSGLILDVMWASMGDWPMFTLTDPDGHSTTWTREGDARRYVPGLRVKMIVDPAGTIARVEVESSHLRVSGLIIGPGGAGLREIGGPGTPVHWAMFGSDQDRDAASEQLDGIAEATKPWDEPGTPAGNYLLRVVGGSTGSVRSAVEACKGQYEGSELLADFGGPTVRPPDF